jgi:hypothetical protein
MPGEALAARQREGQAARSPNMKYRTTPLRLSLRG